MQADCNAVPIILELDFDTFEGPWQYIQRFRGRSGWLLIAEATIQSEHDLMTSRLVAACDECERPIPAFQAEHLAECEWVKLGECAELYPAVLDEVLLQEEGALRAQWLRERNAALAEAFEKQEQVIADLEGRARSRVRQLERKAARLRYQRRHPDTGPATRARLGLEIAAIEDETDVVMDDLTRDRAAVRRTYEAFEDKLWAREDVLVEVEVTHCIQWSGNRASRYSPIYQPVSAPLRRRKKRLAVSVGETPCRANKPNTTLGRVQHMLPPKQLPISKVQCEPETTKCGSTMQPRLDQRQEWRPFSVPQTIVQPEPEPLLSNERAAAVAQVRQLQELLAPLQPATPRHDQVSLLHRKAVLELARLDACLMRAEVPPTGQNELAEQIADLDQRIAMLDRMMKAK